MGLSTCFTAILTHALSYLQCQPPLRCKEKHSGPCKDESRIDTDSCCFAQRVSDSRVGFGFASSPFVVLLPPLLFTQSTTSLRVKQKIPNNESQSLTLELLGSFFTRLIFAHSQSLVNNYLY